WRRETSRCTSPTDPGTRPGYWQTLMLAPPADPLRFDFRTVDGSPATNSRGLGASSHFQSRVEFPNCNHSSAEVCRMNKHLGKVLLGRVLVVGSLIVGWARRPQPHGSSPDAGGPDAELTGPDLFENVTLSTCVDATYHNGEEVAPKNLTILESLGGGVAVFDFD